MLKSKNHFFASLVIAFLFSFIPLTSAFAADGFLDLSFGSGGVAETDIANNANDFVRAGTVDSQDRVITVGGTYFNNGEYRKFAVARYKVDGSLDNTFGNNGKVITDTGDGDDFPTAVVIDQQGRILVAGLSGYKGVIPDDYWGIVRYNSDGTLDTTFGDGGIAKTPGDHHGTLMMAIDSEGGIIVNDSAVAVRLLPDGTLDTNFGVDGLIDLTRPERINSLTYQTGVTGVTTDTQGHILFVGQRYTQYVNASTTDFDVSRYNINGSLDTSFGNGGFVTTDLSDCVDFAGGIALDSQDRIVVAGREYCSDTGFGLARYNSDGTLDATFGNGGKVLTLNVPNAPADDPKLVIDHAGRIIILSPGSGAALTRYNSNGTLDTSFGHNGYAFATFGNAFGASAVAPDSVNRLIVFGDIATPQSITYDFATLRFGGNQNPAAPQISAISWNNNPLPVGNNATVNVSASSDPASPYLEVVGVEFFIGNDPGQGNAAQLNYDQNTGKWWGEFGSSLAPGVYQVNVRAKDGTNTWSSLASSYLVVYDPSITMGITGKNKKDLVPSLANGDVMPGLISAGQTDAADYGFTVDYNNGILDPHNDFQFNYNTGTHCHSQNATNCHTFSLNATSFDLLIIDQTNSSHGRFQGVATITVDGVTTTNPFVVEGIDGDRLNPTTNDTLVLKVYAPGANPATANAIYQASGSMSRGTSVKIR